MKETSIIKYDDDDEDGDGVGDDDDDEHYDDDDDDDDVQLLLTRLPLKVVLHLGTDVDTTMDTQPTPSYGIRYQHRRLQFP